MRRPYRYIDTDLLKERAVQLYTKIQYNADRGWGSLAGELRRELRKINYELDTREKEMK